MQRMLKRRKRGNRTAGKIVVAGEFESGKSSVINALLRSPLLPSNPGMTARPLIQITDGQATKISAKSSDGERFESDSFDDLIENEALAVCRVTTPMGLLADTQVFEVPIHHDGKLSPVHLTLLTEADLIIWVTIASQAWRLSEKAIVGQLPAEAREKAILAISRTDKLHAADDLDKIEKRLQQDASPFFAEIVFMQASVEYLERSVVDARIWQETGGAALASIAHELVVLPSQTAE